MTESSESLGARLARLDRVRTVVLTHHGRKSGKPYDVRIWFTVDGDRVNLQTMNVERQWVRNVLVHPKVSLRIGDELFEGDATPVTDPGAMKRVVELMKKKYPIARPYLWFKKQPAGAFHVALSARPA